MLFGDSIDSNIARWRVGEGTAWYLTDHLGTVRGITNTAGVLVNQTNYDSFGQILNETNSLLGDRFKFTGRELNFGNDYFFRARTYNAGQGRFGSLDQVGFSGLDSNLYRYVLSNPVLLVDPTGNTATVEFFAFVGRSTVLGAACSAFDDVLFNGGRNIFSSVLSGSLAGGVGGAFGFAAGRLATNLGVGRAAQDLLSGTGSERALTDAIGEGASNIGISSVGTGTGLGLNSAIQNQSALRTLFNFLCGLL